MLKKLASLKIQIYLNYSVRFTSDNGACGIVLSALQRLFVGYSKTDHARMFQVHGVDTMEIFLFGFIKTLLGSRDGRRRYHIDETVCVVIDEVDALLGCLGGDEHDDADIVPVGNRFYGLLIILEREVGDDGSRYT